MTYYITYETAVLVPFYIKHQSDHSDRDHGDRDHGDYSGALHACTYWSMRQ